MKSYQFIIGILLFLSLNYGQAKTFKETKGHIIGNHSHYRITDLKVKVRWVCYEGILHPHTCGTEQRETPVNRDGSFAIPSFSVPTLDRFQWAIFSFFLLTPEDVLMITDSRDSSWSEKLKLITLAEVKGLSVSATLKNGKEVNQWLKEVVPRGYLSVTARWEGGVSQSERFHLFEVKSFPFEIPNHYFIFTSGTPLKENISIHYQLTTPIYNTGGFGVTSIYDISYLGPYESKALQSYQQIQLDSSLLNTDATGLWSGLLLTHSEYNVAHKMALSNPDAQVVLKCEKKILTGEIELIYNNEYDAPNFSKKSAITGVCDVNQAQGEAVLTFKEYLGETLINKKVKIITKAISTKTLNANIYDETTQELMGELKLGRVN